MLNGSFFLDNTDFASLLQLSDEYQTNWLKQRISNYFLQKADYGVSKFGMEIIYLADKHDMQSLKDEILKNCATKFTLTNKNLVKKNFKELSDETKLVLAKSRFVYILEGIKKFKPLAEISDKLLTSVIQKVEHLTKPYNLPFQNVFSKPDSYSDVEIKVNCKHSFHLHRVILKRLSGKIGEMVTEENMKVVNIQFDKNEDVGVFLLMLRLFYPRFRVDLSPG